MGSSALRRRSTDIVAPAADGTLVKSVHSDSRPVHADSHPLRIDVKKEFLADVNEARTRLGLSVDAMAALCGVATSAMSDALAGKETRNFAGHWMTALGPDFEATYNQVVIERRGQTPRARRIRAARALGELVARCVSEIMESVE